MKPRFLLIALGLALLLHASPLLASSQHTWVAWYGSDTNAGTQSQPFLTFQGALSQTTPGGVVSALTPGDFGPVAITQAVTIEGIPGASVTFTGSEGIYVGAADGDIVTLLNIHVNGLGTGTDAVFFESGSQLVVENCVLENFTQYGLGIGDTTYMKVDVRNTVIHGGYVGVRTFQSAGGVARVQASLDNVTITGASFAGVFSRNGVVTITNSVIAQNLSALEADTSAQIDVVNTVISENSSVISAYDPSFIRLSHCSLLNNYTINAALGGKFLSDGNNELSGDGIIGPAPSGKITAE